MSWEALWAVVLGGALAAFALISLLIAVKGVGEIRELFDELDARRLRDKE